MQVGVDYVDNDSPVIARQNLDVDGELIVGGAGPVEAMKVRITTAGNPPVIVNTVAFAGAPEVRVFQANMPGGVGDVAFAWLAADAPKSTRASRKQCRPTSKSAPPSPQPADDPAECDVPHPLRTPLGDAPQISYEPSIKRSRHGNCGRTT